jgi:hypothetical protein
VNAGGSGRGKRGRSFDRLPVLNCDEEEVLRNDKNGRVVFDCFRGDGDGIVV